MIMEFGLDNEAQMIRQNLSDLTEDDKSSSDLAEEEDAKYKYSNRYPRKYNNNSRFLN